MKKTFKSLTALILILTMLPIGSVFAEINTEIAYYKGEIGLQYDYNDDIDIEIDGILFSKAKSGYTVMADYTSNGVENSNNTFFLNGTKIGNIINGNGSAELPIELLVEGENELKIVLSTISGTLYDESMIYGEYNLDDFDIISIAISTSSEIDIAINKLIKYLPKTGKSGITASQTSMPNSKIAVGDGWNAATGLGGSTPDIPVCVGFVFDINFDMLGDVYLIDTNLLSDGEKTLKFYNKETKKYFDETDTIFIDNSAPEISFPFSKGETIKSGDSFKINVTDIFSGLKKASVAVNEGAVRSIPKNGEIEMIVPSKIGTDNSITVFAEDNMGNSIYKTLFFTVAEENEPVLTIADNIATIEATADFYGVTILKNINMYTNRRGNPILNYLRSSDEELVQFKDMMGVPTVAAGNAVPYQSFVVDVSGISGEAVVTYSGSTNDGFDIQLSAWNYTKNKWDIIKIIPNNKAQTILINTDIYAKNGQMRINAAPYLPTNNSDTILWLSDTQYYSRFEDLYFQYEAIMNYAVMEYQNNRISYVVHTGDIVDESENDTVAIPQFETGSGMQKILDDAGVPNGVLAGNHDVRHTAAYYDYFKRYFPSSRYSDNSWYGGSFKNNTHHYDLITVSGYDFVILYLGFGMEATNEAVAWANGVLKRYENRNAIIATHEYILPNGLWSGNNAQDIWNKIVVPNDNVIMILCGHNPGICSQWRQVEGSGRKVLEILQDYQYAELGTDPQHKINNITCDGEGFIRLMTFTQEGQLISKTYSPTHELEYYYAPYSEYFIYDLDLIETQRYITTSSFTVGGDIKKLVNGGTSGYEGVYAVTGDGYVTPVKILTDKTCTVYELDGKIVDYTTQSVYISKLWYSKVSPYLTHGKPENLPETGTASLGVNLLPDKDLKINKTGGSTAYKVEFTNEGFYNLYFNDNSSWTSLQYIINNNQPINDYPFIYFGVTADEHSMWNIIITTSSGIAYDFSRSLYKEFGYESYGIPSDITGSWYGRISLEDLLKDGEYVKYVTFVSATKDRNIQFNYLFMGSPAGIETTFNAEGNSIIIDSEPGTAVAFPEPPYLTGHSFDGWYTESNEKVTSGYSPKENSVLTAKYTEKTNIGADYFNTELPMAKIDESKDSNENNPIDKMTKYVIIIFIAMILFSVIIIIYSKKRKININKK